MTKGICVYYYFFTIFSKGEHLCDSLLAYLEKENRPRNYKTFSMLTSAEHEILNVHKVYKYQEIRLLSSSDRNRMLFSYS